MKDRLNQNISNPTLLSNGFDSLRSEIMFFEREITALENQVLELTRRLEKAEDERDIYKQIVSGF